MYFQVRYEVVLVSLRVSLLIGL